MLFPPGEVTTSVQVVVPLPSVDKNCPAEPPSNGSINEYELVKVGATTSM